jgi:tetratricopeptide (TPR) repeat protein
MVPFLIILASVGVFNIWDMVLKKKYRKLIFSCTGVVLIYVLLNYNVSGKLGVSNAIENLSVNDQRILKAIEYESNSDYQSALPEAELAYKMQPDNQRVVFILGNLYYKMNNLKSAEEMFQKTIRISPAFVDAYYNLGVIYNKQRRFDEAEVILEKAVSLDPDDVGAHFELGKTYKAIGNIEGAVREFSLAAKKINRWRSEERAVLERELKELQK